MPSLQNLDVGEVSLVDRAAVRDPTNKNEPMRWLVVKRAGTTGPEGGSMTEAEMRAAVEKADTEREELRKQLQDQVELKAELKKAQDTIATLQKASESDNDDDADDVMKADLPPAVRARLEKAEAEAIELRKQAEEATKIAKAERDERLTRDFIVKAETYKALPVNATEFGPVLKSASEHLSTEHFDALETVLKAADEQIRKGELFKEHGRSGDGPAKPEGAVAELQAKAAEIRKNDPKVTVAKAMDLAMDADSGLAERYLAEVRG